MSIEVGTKFRDNYNKYISKYGIIYTKTRRARVSDSLGYTTAPTTTTATIAGDFQLMLDEAEIREIGEQGVGNAKFYGRTGDDIIEGDILTVNSEEWQFRRRIDDDSIQGTEVSSVWLIIRFDG